MPRIDSKFDKKDYIYMISLLSINAYFINAYCQPISMIKVEQPCLLCFSSNSYNGNINGIYCIRNLLNCYQSAITFPFLLFSVLVLQIAFP